MTSSGAGQTGAPVSFLLAYALAWCGGSIAYVPFLTILLPVRVEALAPQDGAIAWLAYLAFAGAIAASLGHIGFGYLSDITRVRRPWIAVGLISSSALLVLVRQAETLAALVVVLVLWQLALNMMLAPLAALAGDRVPDAHKGLLGGLLAFAPALGAVSGTLVTWIAPPDSDLRLLAVAMIVCLCVGPVLVLGSTAPAAQQPAPDASALPDRPPLLEGLVVRRMWIARLLVQVAEAALFAYLYLWFRSIDPAMTDRRTAQVFSTVLLCSAPVALIVGRWADKHGKPLFPLTVAAIFSSLGLLAMALASQLDTAIVGYAVFGIASAIFLALHAAQTLRVLPRADRRGRDLGLFNLTNTMPSLAMPWLVLALVPQFGFAAMFVLLSVLALGAGLLLLRLPQQG